MAKQTKAQREAAALKARIAERAQEIMEQDGVGYVRALIRARKENGLISPNVGKVRTPATEPSAA